jgi:hypothetical protein
MLYTLQVKYNSRALCVVPKQNKPAFKPFILAFTKHNDANNVRSIITHKRVNVAFAEDQVQLQVNETIDPKWILDDFCPGYDFNHLVNANANVGRDIFIVEDVKLNKQPIILEGFIYPVHEV